MIAQLQPDPITGTDGELIHRLGTALRAEWESNPTWVTEATTGLSFELGLGVTAHKDGRDAFVNAVVERLNSALTTGVRESLLVRGSRDAISEWINWGAQFDRFNRNRAEAREALLGALEDPERLQRMREQRQSRTPDEVAADEMIREEVSQFVNGPLFQPIDADRAASQWSLETFWSELVALYISDDDLRLWVEKRLARRR